MLLNFEVEKTFEFNQMNLLEFASPEGSLTEAISRSSYRLHQLASMRLLTKSESYQIPCLQLRIMDQLIKERFEYSISEKGKISASNVDERG